MHKNRVVLFGIDGTDPLMVEMFVKEKKLPNFARIMQEGFFTRAVPSFTGKTPQNWTTIATGAEPGSHGITDLYVQKKGRSLSEAVAGETTFNGFDSALSSAEFIWNTAENAGLSPVVLNYACATPSTLKENIWVGGSGEPGADSIFTISPPTIYLLEAKDAVAEPLEMKTNFKVINSWRKRLTEENNPNKNEVVFFHVQDELGEGIVLLAEDKLSFTLLREGEYSDFYTNNFIIPNSGKTVKGSYKYKCLKIADKITIYRSKIYPVTGLSEPEGIYEELISKFGPFIQEPGHYDSYPVGHKTYNELNKEQLEWLTKATIYLHHKFKTNLLMMKSHIIDHYNHDHLNQAVMYEEGETQYKESYDTLLAGYKIVDTCLGMLLDNIDVSDTHILLVSDHGCISDESMLRVNDILTANGLVVADEEEGEKEHPVDFSKTQALAVRFGGHVVINLQGRQKDGIVDPKDYEKVQDEIIAAFLNYNCPLRGGSPFAFVLKKQNAGIFGINEFSEHAGDVVFAVKPGYHIQPHGQVYCGDLGSEEYKNMINKPWGAMHGDYWPGVCYKGHSDLATFCGCGPLLKKNYQHDKVFRLTGVGPTICKLLGIEPPPSSEGGALNNVIKKVC